MKKTLVDRFNDSREEESRRLNLKRKMDHDERMASIRLKKHKYDLRYGPGSTQAGIFPSQTPGTSTPVLATSEDKQIEILRLQIRLAELNQENLNSAHASSSHALPFRMPHASGSSSREEVSTPSSSLSYPSGHSGHNGFVNNNFMTSEDADTTNWPNTYNFGE